MGGTMTYTYLGDGTRAAARADAGVNAGATSYAGKRYRGTFVYDVTSGGVQSLESVAVSTGRLTALTGSNGAVSFESDGFITDHLGNVAVVVNLSASSSTSTGNAILEQNEYTPFGTKLSVEGLKSQAANRWRYAGKEEQDIAGMSLRLLDFGARYYDSFTCRWNAVDPLAILYCQSSTYQYCLNNPVKYIDPFGLWTIDDNGHLTAEDGDDLNTFAEYMNVSPQYAYDLLFSQGIDPMNIDTGTIYNTGAVDGSISPSYICANYSSSSYFCFSWFREGYTSNIGFSSLTARSLDLHLR